MMAVLLQPKGHTDACQCRQTDQILMKNDHRSEIADETPAVPVPHHLSRDHTSIKPGVFKGDLGLPSCMKRSPDRAVTAGPGQSQ